MSVSNHLTCSANQGVAEIVLHHAPVNALNAEMLAELESAVEWAEAESTVKVVVFKSGLGKLFSAGADIAQLERFSKLEMEDFCRRMKQLFLRMAGSEKLYAAVIEGHCLGGGLELALACDIRIAKESEFKLGLPEVQLGLFPGGGGLHMAERIIGSQKTFRLAGLGQTISPSTAYEWGLVDELIPAERFQELSTVFVHKLASGPTRALGTIKHLLTACADMPLEDAFAYEMLPMSRLMESADFVEGVRAFREKRAPKYTGR